MNFNNILSVFGIIGILATQSCTTNSDASPEINETNITSITTPENAIVNDNVDIVVDFFGPNGCAEAYNIKAEKVGQTITLRAYYSIPSTEMACTQALVPLQLKYSFFADLPGPYFFISNMDNTISDTLVVY
jgi:hypothetical protein